MRTIAGIRVDLGLSQEELANIIGITKTTLSLKECHKNPWKVIEIQTIRKYYKKKMGVELSWEEIENDISN